jgi:hypothetical protein
MCAGNDTVQRHKTWTRLFFAALAENRKIRYDTLP